MGLLIFLALLAMPVIEIMVFVKAGAVIGWGTVIVLTLATALLGTLLIRAQGFAALTKLQADMAEGKVPVAPAVDGVFLVVAAPLMMTPGFVTDAFGFLLLVPPVRHALARWALNKIKKGVQDGRVTIIRPR